MTSTGISIVSLRNEGFPTFCLCLTTGRHLCFTEKLRNLRSRQMFANSSWGNAATAFSLSSQFRVCGRTCYKLYSGKCCILRKGKRLGGETVGLQYPVWLLRNIDSNVNKYFELKKLVGRRWGAPNSNYLLVMLSTFVMPFSMDPLSPRMTPGCIMQK